MDSVAPPIDQAASQEAEVAPEVWTPRRARIRLASSGQHPVHGRHELRVDLAADLLGAGCDASFCIE